MLSRIHLALLVSLALAAEAKLYRIQLLPGAEDKVDLSTYDMGAFNPELYDRAVWNVTVQQREQLQHGDAAPPAGEGTPRDGGPGEGPLPARFCGAAARDRCTVTVRMGRPVVGDPSRAWVWDRDCDRIGYRKGFPYGLFSYETIQADTPHQVLLWTHPQRYPWLKYNDTTYNGWAGWDFWLDRPEEYGRSVHTYSLVWDCGYDSWKGKD